MDKRSKNVQIPLELFNEVLEVLGHIEIDSYTLDFQNRFYSVLEALNAKRSKMELREDYSRMIEANKSGDENAQLDARISYLKNKRWN